MHHRVHTLDWVAVVLLIIGGLNWLLVGLFRYDIVAGTLGLATDVLSRIAYVIVGLAAIYMIARAPALLHHRPEAAAQPTTPHPV